MKLHIFNPEHDMALASNLTCYTAPHAGRMLRKNLGFIAALWADDGDVVVVDDVEAALEQARHIKKYLPEVVFLQKEDLHERFFHTDSGIRVCPWGWDPALRSELLRWNGGFGQIVPSETDIEEIRTLSNRRFAAEHILPRLLSACPHCIGQATYCTDMESLLALLKTNKRSVLKAPWSSSGRGIRYVEQTLDDHQSGWCRNVIANQGGLMVEPYYNKVVDFGMEFEALAGGSVVYSGLSLFQTINGAYTGNILATEKDKREMIGRYVDLELMDSTREAIVQIMTESLRGKYAGPFGLDMMIVSMDKSLRGKDNLRLHPCVELNLRRTMGHVALRVSPDEPQPQALMRIVFDGGRYRLRITETRENLLNTSLI